MGGIVSAGDDQQPFQSKKTARERAVFKYKENAQALE